MGRCRLEPFGSGHVYPHEQTMPGPKLDRLRLTRATRANLSPIFGLYPDDANEVMAVLGDGLPDEAPVTVGDHLGVVNRLWPVTDPTKIEQVSELVRPRPIFIADGHHRYETACTYRDELAEAGQPLAADHPANFVLMMLVSMSDPGLVIQPTHRLLSGVGPIHMERLTELIEEHFRVTASSSAEDVAGAMRRSGRPDLVGIGTHADGRWALAELIESAVMDRLVPDHSPVWRRLGVSVVHRLLLDRLVLPHVDADKAELTYVHSIAEVEAAVGEGRCDVALVVQAASVEDVRAVAGNMEKMPPKSTYFYPKLLSGLVLNPLA